MLLYIVGGAAVLVLSGLMAMAGLGAAFLFVPLFYYLGVPLPEATSTALLLNAVSLSTGDRLIRPGAPHQLARRAARCWSRQRCSRRSEPASRPAWIVTFFLRLFAAFLVFAGTMMLFYRAKAGKPAARPATAAGVGVGVGGVAGFLGGLLGVGGGNIVLPGLTCARARNQGGCRHDRARRRLLVAFRVSPGTPLWAIWIPAFIVTMAILAAAGSYGRLASHEDPHELGSAQAGHRRPALGDRRQDRLDAIG